MNLLEQPPAQVQGAYFNRLRKAAAALPADVEVLAQALWTLSERLTGATV
ncbi:MAG: hypothetical protein IT495_14135 [Gammaproteobacteria bacterium]|nr:hypothetical protein [Gammaproteobacteria bacterium]